MQKRKAKIKVRAGTKKIKIKLIGNQAENVRDKERKRINFKKKRRKTKARGTESQRGIRRSQKEIRRKKTKQQTHI